MTNKQYDIDAILQTLWTEAFNGSPQYGSVVYGKRKELAMKEAKQAIALELSKAKNEGFWQAIDLPTSEYERCRKVSNLQRGNKS